MKIAAALLVCIMVLTPHGVAQVQWSGEASAGALKSSLSQSPRIVNKGRATFMWRLDLFLDGKVTDNVFVLVNTRVLDDESVNFDYAAIRITDLGGSGINLQVGKFDMPFGNLDDRRFPTKNFLYGLPLIYEYRMSLPAQVVTRQDLLANRGKGVGMRLLDLGIYDVGAMVFGDVGPLHYAVAGSNGTISSTSYGGRNDNSDFDKIVRLAYTPMMGLTVGVSAAMGAYLADGGKALPRDEGSNHYQQLIGEADLEFSIESLLFNAQGVFSQWTVPLENEDTKLSTIGYYGEAKYTWFPRFYTAARISGLIFSRLNLGTTSPRWDNSMMEVEAGIGYHLDRNTIVKLVRRETRAVEVTAPRDNLTVLQFAVSF